MENINRRAFMAVAGAAALGSSIAQAQGAPKKYRACIIGDTKQGGYGHDLHKLWTLREDVEVVGLADPDEQGREEHGKEAGARKLYADYREMLQAEKPDLVAVGPRTTIRHKEYLLACAEIGAHGITEKPLATDLAEMDDIVAAMEAKRLKWCIAFNFRASPIVQHARKAIFEDKLIGEVMEMRARGKEDSRAGGEDLIVLGIHLFDTMINFAGNPSWCWADVQDNGQSAGKEDVREATEPLGPIIGDRIQAMYQFPNNITGFFASLKNDAGNQGRWGLDVFGTKGVVTMRMAQKPVIHYLPDPAWAPGGKEAAWQAIPGAPDVTLETSVSHYQPIIDELTAAIEADRKPDFSIQDARAAHEMVQGVFASARSGGRVELPLKERAHPLRGW